MHGWSHVENLQTRPHRRDDSRYSNIGSGFVQLHMYLSTTIATDYFVISSPAWYPTITWDFLICAILKICWITQCDRFLSVSCEFWCSAMFAEVSMVCTWLVAWRADGTCDAGTAKADAVGLVDMAASCKWGTGISGVSFEMNICQRPACYLQWLLAFPTSVASESPYSSPCTRTIRNDLYLLVRTLHTMSLQHWL